MRDATIRHDGQVSDVYGSKAFEEKAACCTVHRKTTDVESTKQRVCCVQCRVSSLIRCVDITTLEETCVLMVAS